MPTLPPSARHDLTDAEWATLQPEVLALGLATVPAGNGSSLRPTSSAAGACDPVTGMCVA